MTCKLTNLIKLIKKGTIQAQNENINKIIIGYDFYEICENFCSDTYPQIFQNLKESEIIIINQSSIGNQTEESSFFIICFNKIVLIIKSESIHILKNIFSDGKSRKIYFLNDGMDEFKQNFKDKINLLKPDAHFKNEIKSFQNGFNLKQAIDPVLKRIWFFISQNISGYLIKQSYEKLNKSRFYKFYDIPSKNNKEFHEEIWNGSDFVELRALGCSSISNVNLIYNFKKEELFVIKKRDSHDSEPIKLAEREKNNCSRLNHPFLLKYYGYVKDENSLIFEFINGHTLDQIEYLKLNTSEKVMIVFELLNAFTDLDNNKMIYRDLKPSNVMIDQEKTAVLIDFDRLIKISDHSIDDSFTNDFSSDFVAPEVNYGKFTLKSDIYSLGKMIYYIFYEKLPSQNETMRNGIIEQIYSKCIKIEPEKRPNINELYFEFFTKCISKVDISMHRYAYANPIMYFYVGLQQCVFSINTNDVNQGIKYLTIAADLNHAEAKYNLGYFYLKGIFVFQNINKSLYYLSSSADQNHAYSQLLLGEIYSTGKYVQIDMEKGIHYLTLAANNNIVEAQFYLGCIYCQYSLNENDIEKAIHYLSLAAKKNFSNAQYILGIIYESNYFGHFDIGKAINFFTLAADNNNVEAQYSLGSIYLTKQYDIDKALKYLTLAANNNHVTAQFMVGAIYCVDTKFYHEFNKGMKFLTLSANHNYSYAQYYLGYIYLHNYKDYQRAIYYFTYAANQNNAEAQFELGVIYEEVEFERKNIDKALHYYNLAAKQNHAGAQYNIGVIYCNGIYVVRDIKKAIYYLELASKANLPEAQFLLGRIYNIGEYVPCDIKKAMKYYLYAANQNYPKALFYLGLLYCYPMYGMIDVKKGLRYFSQAANQNDPDAQYILGIFYFNGVFTPDLVKSIFYLKLSAIQNHSKSQYYLGIIYLREAANTESIKMGIDYLILSSENDNTDADFALGYLYHEGKHVKRDIEKSIKYYKNCSSFNNNYAKNNLGIIYKHEYGDKFHKNIDNAIVYFEEAIKLSNDKISMYNLAHIYLYEEDIEDIDKAIDLLIKSSFYDFLLSEHLLCLALLKKYNNNLETLQKELKKTIYKTNGLSIKIDKMIKELQLNDYAHFISYYLEFKNYDVLYDFLKNPRINEIKRDQKILTNQQSTKITEDFYEGFGIDNI